MFILKKKNYEMFKSMNMVLKWNKIQLVKMNEIETSLVLIKGVVYCFFFLCMIVFMRCNIPCIRGFFFFKKSYFS